MYIEKNKFGKQFVPITVKVEQGRGIVEEPDLIERALGVGLMTKRKAGWYRYKDEPVAQGSENLILWVRENKQELKDDLKNE